MRKLVCTVESVESDVTCHYHNRSTCMTGRQRRRIAWFFDVPDSIPVLHYVQVCCFHMIGLMDDLCVLVTHEDQCDPRHATAPAIKVDPSNIDRLGRPRMH